MSWHALHQDVSDMFANFGGRVPWDEIALIRISYDNILNRERQRKWRERPANREKKRLYMKERRELQRQGLIPKCTTDRTRAERARRWRERNPEKKKAYDRARYLAKKRAT